MQPPTNAKPLRPDGFSWEDHAIPAQRRTLVVMAAGVIAILLLALSAYAWQERQLALERVGDHGARVAQRLAQDLEQSLNVARAVVSQVDADLQSASQLPDGADFLTRPNTYDALLATLPLPFEVHAFNAQGESISVVGTYGERRIGVHERSHHSGESIEGRWTLSDLDRAVEEQVIPLNWKAAPNERGVSSYGVDLSFAALNRWLERDRLATEDRVSVFWIDNEDAATLVARAPLVPTEIGAKVKAPWLDAALKANSGVLDQHSFFDGVTRRVAFQKLNGAASSLAVVYGAGTQTALTAWQANLPYLIGLALALSAALAYAAWRLDRSLRDLSRSERHYQLILDSGNVWDWDLATQKVRYSPSFFGRLGFEQVPPERMISTLFEAILPEDLEHLNQMVESHLKNHTPYAATFRMRDGRGQIRWFETKGQAHWDDKGQAQYMAGTIFDITERIALEESQRQTLQRLDTVANASSVLFWTSNLNGEVNWVNRRWLAFTGRAPDQELGHGWLEGVHPEDRERRDAFFRSVQTRQEPLSTEYRLRDRDGLFRWMIVQSRPLRDADQQVTGFVGSCVDISQLKQAEDAALQRGAKLEAVFNVLQDLLFIIDQDGRFVHFQGASDERLYVPPDVFLGKLMSEVLPPPITQLIEEQLARAESGQLQEFDYKLMLPDGEHQFDARMARLPGSDQYLFVVRDITERESLKLQRERLQHFLTLQLRLANRFINQPLDTIDMEIDRALGEIGAFVGADRAYIFVYDLEQNIARNTHEWCAPGIHSVYDELQALPIAEMIEWEWHRSGQPCLVPDTLMLEDGPTRIMLEAQGIQSMATLPMNTGDTCLGFVGFDAVREKRTYDEDDINLLHLFAQMLVHVTDRRATEAQLRDLASELETRVQQRTGELAVSVRRLSQANQELESFAYSVSHDLKSPLRSVEGFASLLLEEHSATLNAEGHEYLRRIQGASLHMARLISDLLAYCRMEELDKSISQVRLLSVVNDVLSGMRNELEAQSVQVHLHVPDEVKALANPQGLAMVLRNLIDNAIKFSRPGTTPHITLTACTEGNLMRLCVKDEGQGFDMKYHDRIFALFQRLHRPDAVPGTGIGLAMVYKAVQRMNGRIWAESMPGEGAKFHIELPGV